MDEFFLRSFCQLLDRSSGPLHFRLILQPMVATIIAIRAGLRDARAHQPPFLWTVLSEPTQRRVLIHRGWKDVSIVFVVAFVLDSIYQVLLFRWLHPLQALIVAFVLAIVPYVVIRGPVTRIASRRSGRDADPAPSARPSDL
jgi:hypothetical protein